MSGEALITVLIIVLMVLILGVLIFAGWLCYQLVRSSRDAQETGRAMIELVDRQAALIAAEDALSYQAIRAVDAYASYDDGSIASSAEENAGELGSDGYTESPAQFGGDAFVEGNIFESKF